MKTCIICFQPIHHRKNKKFCSIECKAKSQEGQKPWNLSLTKETDNRVRKYGESGSKTILQQFKEGREKPTGMTGHTQSDDWKRKLSEKNSGSKNPFYGRSHTEESIISIRKKRLTQRFLKVSSFDKGISLLLDSLKINHISQYPIELSKRATVVDEFFPEINGCLYNDGHYWHSSDEKKEQDLRITNELLTKGYRVLRITDLDDLEVNKKKILSFLAKI
jgi:hypothetical protein